MRPLNLVFQAFGSYPDRVEIPFSHLQNGGIYLISGATGSGKTTIFDAICFALFNTTSGSIRPNVSLKSHYAPSNIESFVEFKFLLNGEIYKVSRTTTYERKKSRGEGTIVENSKAQLELPDSKLILGVKEVDEYIVNLLGMNASQFCQIALLAQGEFLKLLNASTKERGEIFRTLFKTSDFLLFQNKLKDKMLLYKNSYETLSNSLIQYIKQIDTKDDELINFINKYIENNTFSLFDEFLNKFQNEINKTNLEINSIKNDFKKISDEIIQKQKLNDKIILKISSIEEKKRLEDELNNKKIIFNNIEKEYKTLDSKQKQLEEYSNDIKKTDDEFNKSKEIKSLEEILNKNINIKSKLISDLSDLKKDHLLYLNNDIEKSKSELLNLQDEYKKFEIKTKKFDEEYNNLYFDYLSSCAGILASNLKENEPCPVCGSINHPKKAKIKTQVSKTDLDEKLYNLNNLKENLNKKANDCEKLILLINQKKDEFLSFEKKYKIEFIPSINNVKKINFEDEIIKLDEKLNDLILENKSIETKILTLKEQLNNKNTDEIIEKRKALENSYNKLNETINKIKDTYEKENISIKQTISKIELLEKQILSMNDIDIENNINIKNEIDFLNIESDKIANNMNILSAKISINEKLENDIKKTYLKYKEIELLYAKLKLLSDCASGSLKGKARIPFEQYIQGYYLDMVLFEANKHLKTMTTNQYQLLRKKESSDLQSKSGLEIEVMDFHTFKQRSTKTLSGGESFKASLSLALGLSDCISSFSSKVNIDAMFIDEGFGTLDSESLNLALDVIMKLSNSNRLVGLISHVDELKSKIQNQIITSKTSNGSTLKLTF